MTVLVTGGAGFLGSHLCDRLLENGEEVLCLDNFHTGSKQNVRSGVEIIRHDVTVPFQVECDAIYHLACPASPIHYQKDPVQTIRTCFLGTLNALDLARRLNIPVLIASTSEVYGDPATNPQKEEYWGHVNPVGIRSCYDEGKRAAECLAMDYWRQYGTKVRIVRIFNTYGPRMAFDDGRVVSNFIMQTLKGEPLTIYGDGEQTRSFCYVEDMVGGLIRRMQHDSPWPINFGTPHEFRINSLAEHIQELAGIETGRVFLPLPENDPMQRKPDIERAMGLGWKPEVFLKDGLMATIKDFRRRMA